LEQLQGGLHSALDVILVERDFEALFEAVVHPVSIQSCAGGQRCQG
jgi:hypothetical protein